MRKDETSAQERVKFVACHSLEALLQFVGNQLCSELFHQAIVINGFEFAVDNLAAHAPGIDILGGVRGVTSFNIVNFEGIEARIRGVHGGELVGGRRRRGLEWERAEENVELGWVEDEDEDEGESEGGSESEG
jgi:hypothetical protein